MTGPLEAGYRFTLYVTGHTPRTQRALAALRVLCEDELGGDYELAVVDVLDRPDLAERARVLATPTLVREVPPPIRRVIGDLTDLTKVRTGLDLPTRWSSGPTAA